MNDRVVIVGATGWLGRAVTSTALSRGLHVLRMGRKNHEAIDAIANTRHELTKTIEHFRPSVVVNCAGSISGSPAELRSANVELVQDLVAACTAASVRLVQIGSAAEYGDPGSCEPISEHAPLRPASEYGRTKAESSVLTLSSGQPGVVARLFNVAGPNPPSSSLLADIFEKVTMSNGTVTLFNAEMRRDWVPLDYAAQAIVDVAIGDLPSGVVNICSGVGITHGELAIALATALGLTISIRSLNMTGVRCVVGDPSLLHQLTGRHPSSLAAEIAASCVLQSN